MAVGWDGFVEKALCEFEFNHTCGRFKARPFIEAGVVLPDSVNTRVHGSHLALIDLGLMTPFGEAAGGGSAGFDLKIDDFF